MCDQDVPLRSKAIYFVRINPKGVGSKEPWKDMAAGMISESALDSYKGIMQDIYIPTLEANQGWGKAREEQVHVFLRSGTRFASSLGDAVGSLKVRGLLPLKTMRQLFLLIPGR